MQLNCIKRETKIYYKLGIESQIVVNIEVETFLSDLNKICKILKRQFNSFNNNLYLIN